MATNTKLIFTPPTGAPAKYALEHSGTYILGTAESCDIILDDDQLAEKHAKLVADETNNTRWFLQDMETGGITVLENGSEHFVGGTQINVSINVTADPAPEEDLEDDEEYEDEDEDEDEDDSHPNARADQPENNNKRQLEDLKKAHQMRELKSSVMLVIVCAILSFAAGVAFRLLK